MKIVTGTCMRAVHLSLAVLLLAALIGAAVLAGAPLNVYDGFETSTLGNLWMTIRFAPGAVVMQSKIVRAGKSAAEITLHTGEVTEDNGKDQPTERAELMEAPDIWSGEDSTYVYSFSEFLPRDFPIVPTRLVLAQWREFCSTDSCEPDRPIIAIRYVGGELTVTHQIGAEKTVLYSSREEIRDRWLDFKFQVRFSRQKTGQIKAWLNGMQIVDYAGPNAFPLSGGYPTDAHFYFKMGLYRDKMSAPMTMYVDEFRKQQLP